MAKPKKSTLEELDRIDEILDEVVTRPLFTGIARSVQAFDNQGFRNFRILTLTIDGGVVVDVKYSDPYASFEAIVKMELANELSIIHLGNRWENGRTLEK